MVKGLGRILLSPFGDDPASPDDFASYVDENYFTNEGDPSHKSEFLFADINPRRPSLVLNTTLLSDTRQSFDLLDPLGYLHRRTADEFFHFAFTGYYFRQIKSNLGRFPLSYGVTASGAFPVLIGSPVLTNFHYCESDENKPACLADKHNWLVFSDGGSNDNQGLIEIFTTLAELGDAESRSEYSLLNYLKLQQEDDPQKGGEAQRLFMEGPGPCARRSRTVNKDPPPECLEDHDRALVFIVNSSITEVTGPNEPPNYSFLPFPLVTLYRSIMRVNDATDVYSGASYNLRKRLYETDLEDILRQIRTQTELPDDTPMPTTANLRDINITPVEIGLVTLNDYPEGGAEAANVEHALLPKPIDAAPNQKHLKKLDHNAQYLLGVDRRDAADCGPTLNNKPRADCETYERRQHHAFMHMTHEVRQSLALNDIHPQCMFEQSKLVEASLFSLASMDKRKGVCLRQAARWSAALRAEEICHQMDLAGRKEHGYYPVLNNVGDISERAKDMAEQNPKALYCDHGHLAPLEAHRLAEFAEFDRNNKCDLLEGSESDQKDIQSGLTRNFVFTAEVDRLMRRDPPKWLAAWKRIAQSSSTRAPANGPDFVRNFPLDQVCNMALYEPELFPGP